MSQLVPQSELKELLEPNPKLTGVASDVASDTEEFLQQMLDHLEGVGVNCRESFQVTMGMQKLLEAKDCFVRAIILAEDE